MNDTEFEILLKEQKDKYIPYIELLNKIQKFAFDNVTCNAGVYCENLEHIRKMCNEVK